MVQQLPLGVTQGDASGVGPEILLRAFAQGDIRQRIVVFGDEQALRFYNRKLAIGVPIQAIHSNDEARSNVLNVRDAAVLKEVDITPGQLNAQAGRAARDYVVAATEAALARQISAIVTLPMNKEATQLSDPDFVGHTELIGHLCGVSDVTIMLVSDQLIVTHVSTHCSLRDAIERTKRERIQTIIGMTYHAVRRIIPEPRIAVAGLNPHAGENGLFGFEERTEIEPAVRWAREQGMPVSGPFPPDTLFYMAVRRKQFDAVICMYHDQGHIPSKLLDFEGGVNVALGLPIIRTSVDHGTAFDIAGKGQAQISSFLRALDFAVRSVHAHGRSGE